MYRPIVFLSLCVICLSTFVQISGQLEDKEKTQAKEHHHNRETHQKSHHIHQKKLEENHQKVRKEKYNHFSHALGLSHNRHQRVRQTDNCTSICVDEQLLKVIRWLNGTEELKLLYKLLPPLPNLLPSGPGPVLPPVNGTNGTSNSNDTNTGNKTTTTTTTLPDIVLPNPFNSTNNSTGNSTTNYPIFSHLFKLFAQFVSDSRGIVYLFKQYPEFRDIWKEFVSALSFCGSNKPEVVLNNLKDLFGSNGTFGQNFFNTSYWEQFFPWNPTNIIKDVEHGIEHGINTLFNLTGIFGRKH